MTKNELCPFFGRCGGCLFQDLSEDEYLEKKQNFIRRAFADYGIDVILDPIRTLPLASRRRASFAYHRGKVGYNALKRHDIITITECRLLRPEIVSFLPTLQTWVQQIGGKGDIFVRTTEYGLDIQIKPAASSDNLDLAKRELLAKWAAHPTVARLTYGREPIAEKVPLPLSADSFLQPSAEGEHLLIDLMLEGCKDVKRAVDLFCGCGTFTRPLLERGIKVMGYDCSDSVTLLGENGVQRDLFRSPLLAEELTGTDLVVLDPPRAGAKAQIAQIAQTDVPRVIMISCAPPTAARDCQTLLNAGWRLTRLVPVDQFRWSNHIELVCFLEKIS